MNIILFQPEEVVSALPCSDPRAVHLLQVLRRKIGDTFDAGLVNGPRGKGTLVSIEGEQLTLSFAWGELPPELDPITVVLGLPRPQTARKILQEATALGVSTIHFVMTERGDPSYARSTLWTSDEWYQHLITGAQQAFCTRLPSVSFGRKLDQAIDSLSVHSSYLVLDNYEAVESIGGTAISTPVVIALGPERGWSARDRDLLRSRNYHFVKLGDRVLRVETACVAAVSVVKGKLGLL